MQVNAVNVPIQIETGRDMSASTTLRLRVRGPTPPGHVWDRTLGPESIIGDKTKGTVQYVTVDGDFPIPGQYSLQVFDETGGSIWPSEVVTLIVRPNLPPPD